MNEKHYHATRHLRFAPIDTDKIPPNARYWQNSAQDQLCRLQELIGDEEALKMVIHIEGTWRAVYDAIKTLADLAEAQIQYASELAPVDESAALNQKIRDNWDTIPEIPF